MENSHTPEDRKERRREFRRQALQKSKFAIPSGVTLLSIFCGFSSVVMSLNASTGDATFYLKWSAIFLILAGIFDGMDGRLARMTNTTTEFGIQLDSIADITSFGMAPAIMAYQYAFLELGKLDPQLKFIGWAACFFYLACGALRLARFNIQTKETDP
ncbi:MAG TPA: CDP-diacylglycerol--serine O-phosphatidyltransferase, partial [Acidobacteria bacterium]|nr:CDP-diacylglycerol--serine O-phosphatidyltransferase [Acidobacteriota bacterium]